MKLYFVIPLLLLSSCANGPEIPILFWSQARTEFNGKDAAQKPMTLDPKDPATAEYLKAHKLVCTTDEGERVLLDWMKRNCGGNK